MSPPLPPHLAWARRTAPSTGYDEDDHYLREFCTARALPMPRLDVLAQCSARGKWRGTRARTRTATSPKWASRPRAAVAPLQPLRARHAHAGRPAAKRRADRAGGAYGDEQGPGGCRVSGSRQRRATTAVAGDRDRHARSAAEHSRRRWSWSAREVATIVTSCGFIARLSSACRISASSQSHSPASRKKVFHKAEWDGTPLERAPRRLPKSRGGTTTRWTRGTDACSADSDGPKLSYADFRHQLRMSLGVKLAKDEVEALAQLFDPEAQGYISGAEFSRHFTRAGITARQEERTERGNVRRTKGGSRATRAERDGAPRLRGTHGGRVRHVRGGGPDVGAGQTATPRGHVGCGHRARTTSPAFNCKMSMKEFRDQLTKSFGIKMTPAEMGGPRHVRPRW